MKRFSARLMLAGLLMMVALAGCFPATDKDGDEEKDPHFLRGRSLVGSQDFQGAVDEYEKALETNPRNASAHFELGWLDKEKVQPPDYAAAIYHYQRHLALRPDSGHAQQARDQILACKRALAETEFQLPSNPDLQREVDRLNAENLLLKQQNDALRAQLGQAQPVVLPPQPQVAPQPRVEIARWGGISNPPPGRAVSPVPPVAPAKSKVYAVAKGDNMWSIAQKNGVTLEDLKKANPGVDPQKLSIGQSLNVPAH